MAKLNDYPTAIFTEALATAWGYVLGPVGAAVFGIVLGCIASNTDLSLDLVLIVVLALPLGYFEKWPLIIPAGLALLGFFWSTRCKLEALFCLAALNAVVFCLYARIASDWCYPEIAAILWVSLYAGLRFLPLLIRRRRYGE